MLVRVGLDYRDEQLSIWIKIPSRGSVYREQLHLIQPKPNTTGGDEMQTRRWRYFLRQWVNASKDAEVHLIEDTNLYKFKWEQPNQINMTMASETKNMI